MAFSVLAGFAKPTVLTATVPRTARWRPRRLVLGGAVILASLVVWQLYSNADPNTAFFISSPTKALRSAGRIVTSSDFWRVETRATASGFFLGWVIAVVGGLVIGTAMGWVLWVRESLEPFVYAVNSVPRIALIPVLTLWLGYDLTYKAVVVALMSFFPILLNTAAGVRRADDRLLRMSRSFGATRWQLLRTVALPGALPMIFAGLRQSLTYAITGIIAAEILNSSAGLGWMIAKAEINLKVDQIVAVTLLVTIGGTALNEVLRQAERACTRWRPEPRV
jgi:ABC-type nitrate/sulfonate/bicarbonate transport system permease component